MVFKETQLSSFWTPAHAGVTPDSYKMKIILYRSNLCPRCFLAKKNLLGITGNDPDIQIEEVDILGSPQRCLQDGIRMVPALVIGKDKLSGVFLSKKAIKTFINRHQV